MNDERHRSKIDQKLKCRVLTLDYVPDEAFGRLYMMAGHCCDMTACIDLFKAIDPKVRLIHTFSGEQFDTCYVRERGGWTAFQNPRE